MYREVKNVNMNLVDIIIIGVAVWGIIDGAMRGVIISLINTAAIFISLYFGKYVSAIITGLIMSKTGIYAYLRDAIAKKILQGNEMSNLILGMIKVNGMPAPDGIAYLIINAASFIIFLALVFTLVRVVGGITKGIVRKTPLGIVDKLGGAVFGLMKALIILFLVFALVLPLLGVISGDSFISSSIENSKFAVYFMKYNFVLDWLKGKVMVL